MDKEEKNLHKNLKPNNFSPSQVLVTGFASIILVGAILLMLPISSRQNPLGFIDALFTATSAVCVTGLVVVDTGTYFTGFGQTVIMCLIFIGSLGFMTMASTIFMLAGKRITLKERLLIQESLNQFSLQGMVLLTKRVFQITVLIEFLGAAIMSIRFIPEHGVGTGLFYSIFHSVSAFGNAGFDLIGGFRSLTQYATDPLVAGVILVLFILGGVGFTVLMDVFKHWRWVHFRLHTKLVLILTASLLLGGTALILLLEWNNAGTLGPLSPGGKIFAALFTAATPRTAGFNVIGTEQLSASALVVICGLMFIGASPASTGGGIKTTTFGIIAATVVSTIRGNEDINILGRRFERTLVVKAFSIAVTASLLIFIDTIVLMITENAGFLPVLFEVISAFGTVGLSMGITTSLTSIGRTVIILTMFAGRVGLLTMIVALAQKKDKAGIRYPKDKILIG